MRLTFSSFRQATRAEATRNRRRRLNSYSGPFPITAIVARMAKSKGSSVVPNRALHNRLSFLYQAAALLATAPAPESEPSAAVHTSEQNGLQRPQMEGMSRRLLTDMRSVSHKARIRIGGDMKRTICKHCDTLLVEGVTCTSTVENQSRGGAKPWADVLIIKCKVCDRAKRFPVNARREPGKAVRLQRAAQLTADAAANGEVKDP